MATDFTKGRYNVYAGRGPLGELIGRIDEDEFIRGKSSELLYRIDDDQVYETGPNARYIGTIFETEGGRAMVVDTAHVAHMTIVPE
jgi:hypothetical protein